MFEDFDAPEDIEVKTGSGELLLFFSSLLWLGGVLWMAGIWAGFTTFFFYQAITVFIVSVILGIISLFIDKEEPVV